MPDVDSTMAKITEQREIANEIAEALSNPSGTMDADEVRLSPDLKSAFVLMI
jgi:charged multivesicular body protein 4